MQPTDFRTKCHHRKNVVHMVCTWVGTPYIRSLRSVVEDRSSAASGALQRRRTFAPYNQSLCDLLSRNTSKLNVIETHRDLSSSCDQNASKMHKMWSFSTLQRPTQEEKERRRKYNKDEKLRQVSTLLPKSKVGRAKTFRMERNNNDVDFDNGPASLPVSASMVEVLRHRAKSASRHNTEDVFYTSNDYATSTKRRGHKGRDSSAAAAFVSRLRFFDNQPSEQPQKLRWQDREPSSGYSSGGGRGGHDPEVVASSDDNMYGVKFASMPHISSKG